MSRQYQRTYVLLPPSADAEWVTAVARATWNKHRYTIGGSADDAGIGDLDARNVIAVNAHQWPGNLKAFLDEHYPGVVYIPVEAYSPNDLYNILSRRDETIIIDPVSKHPIAGTHDQSGLEWMIANKVRGWCTIPVYLGTHARYMPELERAAGAGVNVILNLRYGWSTDRGGQGSMPTSDYMPGFIRACVNTIVMNPSVYGFVIGNEDNNAREWPVKNGVKVITMPETYSSAYNAIYSQSPRDARIAPGAIDPFNDGWGDWRVVWRRDVLDKINGAEFVALHAYTHGRGVSLTNDEIMFGGWALDGVYYNLRVFQSQKNVLPPSMSSLPIVVTECNPCADGGLWRNDGEWARRAFHYLATWGAKGVCMYRHSEGDERYVYGNKPDVMHVIKECGK